MGKLASDAQQYALQSATSGTTFTQTNYTLPARTAWGKSIHCLVQNGTTSNVGQPSSVTLGGVNCVLIPGASTSAAASGFTVRVDCYFLDELLLPAIGQRDVVANGLPVNSATREVWWDSTCYEMIMQGQPQQVDADAGTSGTTLSNTLNPLAGAYILSAYVFNITGTQTLSITAGGETERYDNDQSATAGGGFATATGAEGTAFTTTIGGTSYNRGVRGGFWWMPYPSGLKTLLGVGR